MCTRTRASDIAASRARRRIRSTSRGRDRRSTRDISSCTRCRTTSPTSCVSAGTARCDRARHTRRSSPATSTATASRTIARSSPIRRASPTRALAAGMRGLLATASGSARDCLQRQLGRIADRASCQGPWTATANLTFLVNPLKVRLPQRANLAFQLSNPLSAADVLLHGEDKLHGWGQTAAPANQLLFVRGFDAAAAAVSLRRQSAIRCDGGVADGDACADHAHRDGAGRPRARRASGKRS